MGYVNDLAINVNIFICQNNIVNTLPADTQVKIPLPQKPNSSLIFTGRKDIPISLGRFLLLMLVAD